MAANNTIDESIALITAANTVVQNPESVGNAMKTISMRIRGAKSELEEMGEDTEGMVDSTAKLREEILALSGVDIMENANEFKSTYKIMDELAAKWEDLSDIQQATVTELIAGKRQGNIVSSLMSNFDTARDALETSINSSGSAMQEHEKWQKSLEAQILKLKASWQSLSQTFLSSDFLKGALDAVIGLVDALDWLIDKVGALPALVTAFAAFKSFGGKGFFKVIEDDAARTGHRISSIFTDAFHAIKSIKSNAAFSFDGAFSNGLNNDIQSLNNFKAAVASGMTVSDAFEAHMINASKSAQVYARSMDTSALSTKEFEIQQRMSELSMQAQNKSFVNCGALINSYNNSMETCGLSQAQFLQSIQQSNPALHKYLSGLNGAQGSLKGYVGSLIGAKAATIGMQIATTALNAALTMGISVLISWAVSGIQKLINAKEELAEKVEEITTKFKEQHDELQKLKGDYDTANETSMISKYEKLSKGVDNLGRNVSLTADEYSEYQSIVNKIAEQIPSLVSGYDSQGNALLSCKGNVEELTAAYEKLIHSQNQAILISAGDIEKDFKNTLKDAQNGGVLSPKTTIEDIEALEYIYNNGLRSQDEIAQYFIDEFGGAGISEIDGIARIMQDADIEGASWAWGTGSSNIEALAKQLEEDPTKIKAIIENYYEQFADAVNKQKSIAQAKLSEAFDVSSAISDLDYSYIGEDLQSVAYQIVNSLDFDFFTKLQEQGKTVEQWTTEMLNQLNSLGKNNGSTIEAAFDLQTQFNGGEISYGEYVEGLEDVGRLIDSLTIDSELKTQLKLSLGLNEDGIVEEYQQLTNRLYQGLFPDDDTSLITVEPDTSKLEAMNNIKKFVDDLSVEEFEVLVDIIPELDISSMSLEEIESAIRLEMMLQGLTFDLNLEVEAAGVDALNTALAESVSATGLSSESISALKDRYADLEAQGYDLSAMFEESSHGIHLNRQEFNRLEKAYATEKLAEVNGDLEEMKVTYDDLGEAIRNTDDPVRKAELYNDRQTLAKRISEAATLASQYEGLTSAYNDWLAAEEAGQERDMYENVIEGFENIGDEISRGWYDDATIEFLEMLTGRTDLAGKSAKELKEIYNGLDKTIKYIGKDGKVLEDTGYSVRDFFTVDDEGNSTADGVYNFLDAIGKLEEEAFLDEDGNPIDVVKRIEEGKDKGKIIGFDFELAGGDEAIADALGISKELVQIMKRAADDAGFVVSLDGTYKQLADLKNEAKASAQYLKSIGKTEYEFDFDTTNVDSLAEQLEEAHTILADPTFWNKDGTFNFNADGATEAMQVVSTLQAQLDNVTEKKYGIGLTVEDEEFEEPLENLQEYGRTVQTLNQLNLNPKANADEIKELEGELDDIAQYFVDLDKDTKIKLGFEADDGIEEVKEKIASGEVTIPTVLDIQTNMDKNLETLADLALLNSGLLSENEEETIRKKYKVEVEADEVDTSDVEDEVENSVIDGLGNPVLSREANIEIIAETLGIEDVDNLSSKLEGLDDKTIQAIAEAIGQGNVEALDLAIAGMDGNEVDAVCNALGYGSLEELKTAIRNMKGNEVDAKVNTEGQQEKVNTFQSWIDGLVGKVVPVTVSFIKTGYEAVKNWLSGNKGSTRNDSNGFSNVNGTANVNGTTGRAFKQGSWGTKNSGTALVGELGREVLVRDGRYYTIGDNGAEFIKYKQGDIIFNHVQSEELFKNGKVTSNGGRAKAFASGTAFDEGVGGGEYGGTAVGTDKNSDDFKESIDWIEVLLERLERTIDKLDKTANNAYNSWSSRNDALDKEIKEVGNLIQEQRKARDVYLQEANKVGLDESWAKKVREGSIDIDSVTDESLKDKIDEYQKWYELYLKTIDAANDLRETESKLYAQRFENISAEYDDILQQFEHTESMLDEYISQAEAQGYLVSGQYYEELIYNEKNSLAQLREEQAALIAARDWADVNGAVVAGSQKWMDMCAEIDGVTEAIEEGETAILKWAKSLQELDWEIFELSQERISAVNDEADFLIDLMSNKDMYDDKGNITAEGKATMALHGQKYNTYMYQADDYGDKVAELDSQIANDPYNQDLINKRNEYLELQRESILAAEGEKDAIKDLVSEGIEKELDALQELINKKNEELDSEKSLYEYQKKVKEQTEEIASLEKQIAAYSGDNSDESKSKIQSLKVSLEDAKETLQESEYDRYISDQSALLDSLYDEYELTLNTRLDNIDTLLESVITEINTDASDIKDTLTSAATNVGTTLSDAMSGIWDTEGGANKVIGAYGEDFKSKLTNVNTTLGNIKSGIDTMITKLGKGAEDKINEPKTSSASIINPVSSNNGNKNNTSTNTGKTKSGNGKPEEGDKVKFLSGKYYYDSQGKKPLGSKFKGKEVYITNINTASWATHPYHISTGKKLGQGDLGWLKLSQISGYATGKKNLLNGEIAWTQENGREFIVRPSDGAILTPIAKGDSVLNAQASSNIWDMANSPAEFIKDNLSLGATNVPNNSNSQSHCVQNFDKVIFNMPNVRNYEQLLSEMQKDKNFERLVLAMTIDRIAGKSSLGKGKSIR